MLTLDQFNFAGKKALVRVDYNVPMNDKFEITNDNRLVTTLPTLNKILNDGGSVILMSHMGRPKNGPENKFSLVHLVDYLSKMLGREVQFANDCIGTEAAEKSAALQPGQVLLLENLRFYKQEEAGDTDFAKTLASYGDVWVMDAFGTAHRAHASTAVMGQFVPSRVCGYVMQAELDNAAKVLTSINHPYTAIMGGSKISSKIVIIENLLDKGVDNLIIGGAMSYTFFKAMGGQVGKSLVENDQLELALSLIERAKANGINLLLPQDSVVASNISADAQTQIADNMSIGADDIGLDIGPAATAIFTEVIRNSATVLWNGPVGMFELAPFAGGTKAVCEALVEATEKGAYTLVGGGDSGAAIAQFGLDEKVSYVSTGGGALLEYMEGKVLPGVAALQA